MVMIMKYAKKENNLSYRFLALPALLVSTMANAAPGVLQDVPLSVGTYVQPNILFLIDDSGSMNWGILRSDGANDNYPSYRNSGSFDITPTFNDQHELLESCAMYNVMYYDPNKTYTPWVGKNEAGDEYIDRPITSAPQRPYPTNGNYYYNLLTEIDVNNDRPGYIPYNDVDGDGEFDIGDCYDGGTVAQMHDNFVPVTEMSSEQQVNFSNWFTYYRTREHVVKRALSEIIDNNTSRVGLGTLHNNNDVGTIIKDIDDVSQPINTDAVANKEALLTKLFQVDSYGGTPLRQALYEAGLYFTEGANPSADLFGTVPDHSGTNTVSTNSPILNKEYGGSCQQNFSILFSDGEWNGSLSASVGNTDGDNNTLYDGGNFADTYSNTLADVAMKYLENDLSSTLPDSLNVTDIRQTNIPIKHQHMTSYMVAFGVEGTFSESVTETTTTGATSGANDPSSTGFAGWPQPVDRKTKIDDLRHAAWNGRGGYLDAGTPEELIDSLSAAVEDIQARTGTATSVSFNSGSINTDTLVYQSRFTTDDWSGDVLAYRFDENGVVDINGDNEITSVDAIWSADDQLNAALSASGAATRNVITYNGVQGVPFVFPADYNTLLNDAKTTEDTSISDAMIIDILSSAKTPADVNTTDADEIAQNQTFGEQHVDYLKGDVSNEIDSNGVGLFRNRNGKALGSFIFSSPQYAGVPDAKYPDLIEGVGNEYSTYKSDNDSRSPLVFAGANDGMLHAFDGSDNNTTGGQEVLAYIPGFLDNDLQKISEVSTNYAHKSYVDSSPVIADVFVQKNGTGTAAWRTYLAGGVRTGGQGVYVLDVSDPAALATASSSASNASDIVVKEFTDTRMGFSFSRPQIAKLNNGRWAAIFGNGYNNNGDGKAHLFILYLDNGEHKRIEVSEPSITYLVDNSCYNAASNCNGLSSPSLADLNNDFVVDRVYAGDVHGNLWAFDLSSTDADDWGVAFKNGTNNVEPLFTACAAADCALEYRQPITTKPVIKFHPSRYKSSTAPNMMIYFGTGQLIAVGDNQTTDLQSFYGVWDAGVNKADGASATLTKANLQAQTFDSNLDISSESVDFITSSDFGWYVDLAIAGADLFSGARSVNTPLILGDIVFFLISIPDEVVCSGGGTSYLAALNLLDGTQSSFNIFDTDGDGKPDSAQPLTLQDGNVVGIGSIDNKVVTTGSDGGVNVDDVNTQKYIPQGRKSWTILR